MTFSMILRLCYFAVGILALLDLDTFVEKAVDTAAEATHRLAQTGRDFHLQLVRLEDDFLL